MEKMKNRTNIGIKMCGVLILLMVSVVLTGCVDKSEVLKNDTKETVILKYIENRDPIVTKDDLPGFKLIEYKYFVVPEKLTLSLETESFHGTATVNASDGVPNGTRLYGGSEKYNVDNRYILLQYKVFDKSDKLDESMNITVGEYVDAGFDTVVVGNSLSDIAYGKRIFMLELDNANVSNMNKSNTSNINKSNVANNITSTNKSGTNIIVILFGYDTVLGKIGIQDSKDKSLDESLKMLDIALSRLKVVSKETVVNKDELINQSMRGQKV